MSWINLQAFDGNYFCQLETCATRNDNCQQHSAVPKWNVCNWVDMKLRTSWLFRGFLRRLSACQLFIKPLSGQRTILLCIRLSAKTKCGPSGNWCLGIFKLKLTQNYANVVRKCLTRDQFTTIWLSSNLDLQWNVRK